MDVVDEHRRARRRRDGDGREPPGAPARAFLDDTIEGLSIQLREGEVGIELVDTAMTWIAADGFPGWLTLWRGWAVLRMMVTGAEAMGRGVQHIGVRPRTTGSTRLRSVHG